MVHSLALRTRSARAFFSSPSNPSEEKIVFGSLSFNPLRRFFTVFFIAVSISVRRKPEP
jgi:hypothetical protein